MSDIKTPPGGTLTDKLALISQEIGVIQKTRKQNSGVPYAFRGIDDIMNALNPPLAKYGVSMFVTVKSFTLEGREGANKKLVHLATVYIALGFTDGFTVQETEEVACSEDYGDKALTQAMSMAFKYAILRKFCIPTEDIHEPDNKPLPPGPLKGEQKPVPVGKPKKPILEMSGKEMTKEWANLVKKLGTGEVDMEKVKAVYVLTADQEKKLQGYVKK